MEPTFRRCLLGIAAVVVAVAVAMGVGMPVAHADSNSGIFRKAGECIRARQFGSDGYQA